MSQPLDYPELIALEALMQLMLQAAKDSNWTELSRIDLQRKALLEQKTEAGSDHPAERFTKDSSYTKLAEQIMRLDRQIIATVVEVRDGLASENRDLHNQVKAKAIYQQASAMSQVSNR